nr:hypothetical protein [Streptomyces scabichelini]
MTVEAAPAVMTGARVEYLILCDGDDRCTGLITRARLAVLRDSYTYTYTDRIRLRDILDGPRPGQSALLPPVRHHALRHRPVPVRPDQERGAGLDEGRQARAHHG